MIRAHMASFPPRKALMLENIKLVLPQVDRLFLTLNQFDTVPDEIRSNEKIETVIPKEDLLDVGKFYFTPEPNDFVFTMDDDLIYPPDYVEHMLSVSERVDFDTMLVGLHGLSVDLTERSGFKYYHFRRGIKSIRGVSRLGTGVALMKGCCYPPMDAMRGAEGFVDIRFAQWQIGQGNIMWTVPRTRGWVKGNAPDDIAHHSLTERYLFKPTPQLIAEHKHLLRSKAPNDGFRYFEWRRQQSD